LTDGGSASAAETVTDDRLAIANDVGDDGNEAQRHLRKINVGVADFRFDRAGGFDDLGDSHDALQSYFASEEPPQI